MLGPFTDSTSLRFSLRAHWPREKLRMYGYPDPSYRGGLSTLQGVNRITYLLANNQVTGSHIATRASRYLAVPSKNNASGSETFLIPPPAAGTIDASQIANSASQLGRPMSHAWQVLRLMINVIVSGALIKAANKRLVLVYITGWFPKRDMILKPQWISSWKGLGRGSQDSLISARKITIVWVYHFYLCASLD